MDINTFNSSGRKIVEVAVGVLKNNIGSVLLAQRPEGKPYAGYWEFPGGKLEIGETVFDALYRELLEEIDVQILNADKFMVIEHDYPHAYVRLHVCLVTQWQGEPKGLENQSLAWLDSVNLENISQINLQPILAATIPILEKLKTL
jgi:8-oxo-dGTP diphosphatase